jgi:8-oxo-dGTP diphosphatase
MSDTAARSDSTKPAIRIAAAVIRDSQGRHLLVRKVGTNSFMQAGGKLEQDERPIDALRRELAEELNLSVGSESLHYLGVFEAQAAHEPGHIVIAHIYELETAEAIRPSAEIEELLWVDRIEQIARPLAPLTRLLLMRCSKR